MLLYIEHFVSHFTLLFLNSFQGAKYPIFYIIYSMILFKSGFVNNP